MARETVTTVTCDRCERLIVTATGAPEVSPGVITYRHRVTIRGNEIGLPVAITIEVAPPSGSDLCDACAGLLIREAVEHSEATLVCTT